MPSAGGGSGREGHSGLPSNQQFAPPYDDRVPTDGVDQATPSEGGAFAETPDSAGFGADEAWDGDDGTELIGKLGYVPKEMRDGPGRRNDKKKYKTFQRKRRTNPLFKIGIGLAALVLVGGAGWWVWNWEGTTESAEDTQAYSELSEPCAHLDLSPVSEWGDEGDMDRVDEREPRERSRGWEQSCDYGWSVNNGAGMTVEVESTVFESDSRASNTFDRGIRTMVEDTNWEEYETDGFGEEIEATSRGWEDDTGTSNYQVHVRDANVYLLVRVTVYDDVDSNELADATNSIAEDYLSEWRSS